MKKRTLKILIGLFIILISQTFILASIPATERAALVALYNSTNGDNWINNSGWKYYGEFGTPGNEKNWYGVRVNRNNTHVMQIFLNSNNLTGTLPVELGDLKFCTEVDFYNNKLTGTIPKEIGDMTALEYFRVYINELTGEIPPELGNLYNLEYLSLECNHLTGEIPPEFGNLVNLQRLYLGPNKLTGRIPPEIGILTNLTNVLLVSNMLDGEIPNNFTNLTNMRYFNMNYNCYHTDNPDLYMWLNNLDRNDPNWEYTQTIAPKNLIISPTSIKTEAQLTWAPILYTKHGGGYQLYFGTVKGGPYDYVTITADKFANNFTFTGLAPATTYYFVIKTKTGPRGWNNNVLISEYSQEVSFTTEAPPETFFEIGVTDEASDAIPINLSEPDNDGYQDGVTTFKRKYKKNKNIRLTAPYTHKKKKFLKWVVNGSTMTSRIIYCKMSKDHSAKVYYKSSSKKICWLKVDSNHKKGAYVIVSKTDSKGLKNGNVKFSRYYEKNTRVSLKAPKVWKKYKFNHWKINGKKVFKRKVRIKIRRKNTKAKIFFKK